MNVWQEAWRLATHDLKRTWLINLITTVFAMLTCLVCIVMLNGDPTDDSSTAFVVDMYLLSVSGVFGCPWYTSAYTTDTRRQLAWMRTLPISLHGLVGSRFLLILMRATCNGLLFFGTLYLSVRSLRDLMSPLEYLCLALIWSGFGLILSGWYQLWEVVSHLRKFWVGSTFAMLALMLLIEVLFRFVWDTHALTWTVQVATEHGFVGGVLAMAVGLLAMVGWGRAALSYLRRGSLFEER